MNVYILIILFWYRISNSYRNVPKQPHLTLLLVLLSSQFSLLCNGDDVLFEKSVWFSEKVSICDISSVKPRGCYYDDLVTWRINLKSINIQGPLPACMLFSCSWLLMPVCAKNLPEGKSQPWGNSDLDPWEDDMVSYKTTKARSQVGC